MVGVGWGDVCARGDWGPGCGIMTPSLSHAHVRSCTHTRTWHPGCSPPDTLNSGVVSFEMAGCGFGSLHLWCVRLGPAWQVSGRMILRRVD